MGALPDVVARRDPLPREVAASDGEALNGAAMTASALRYETVTTGSESLSETGAASGESLNAVWVEFIVEMLSAAGVRRAVLCPGGRASAMCLAFDAHPRIAVEMVSTDERSGAFIALGIAKASGEPVAIVTTSGSAVANVLPALTEADASDVPLVVLTCDRPRALRGTGFGQMADHLGATRAFVRAQADLEDPEDAVQALEQARDALAAALAAMSRGVADLDDSLSRADAHPSSKRPTRGPVHINVPLAGVYDAVETQPVSFETVRAARAPVALDDHAASPVSEASPARIVEGIMARVLAKRGGVPLSNGLDGLIVVGPEPGVPLEAIFALAAASGFPVLADAGSGLRSGPFALAPQAAARGAAGALIVNAFDVFGGAARLASARAELIVRFGLAPVMPVLHTYLETHADVPTIKIAPCRVAHDYLHPALDPRDVLIAPSSAMLHEIATTLSEEVHGHTHADASPNAPMQPRLPVAFSWRDRWASVAGYGARERRACVASLAWGEVSAVHRVLATPGFAFVHLGNSMSMRHADIGYDVRAARQDIYVNRGVSGIDGTMATFIGEALVRGDAGLLLLGDQALIHDLSSLASAQRVGTPACICVVDNGGGAIFDFLPIAHAPAYRRTIRNPYKLDIGALAQAFGLAHHRVEACDALDHALAEARDHAGVTIVEVAVEPYSGALQMQQLAQALGAT
ncbi:2-succinyl-5-enolpyruvyl-6-hydroxy-3-cyclohexene-1-carboxylate synthase [Paraburkholderia sediminicola]|uniref:2-succinyl-5-enolpyruvyl-6-hydroxy-3-cyclohexene-1-carboxylate synthase n=1 Tax=Paraburkholderia sediminicola TaxID=458836 RepID=A0A6J5AM86_9BURK|nr:2-succinyl-5-enolpyruvyl-6-hydroxy-3-cyclohexene-1-carboxylic-acid synthase [Paraburkholderia sediminicola]CAB3675289.1 2-succinyl-5-enolpyruvyl-6-hydroxy-3-cyclohexene-1-carboxylate synthase [Paraburkholderia sediminicola]